MHNNKYQTMMGISLHSTLLLLLVALIMVPTIQARSQSGFISIDCGLPPENSNYTEENSGIRYISDSEVTHTGESKSVAPGKMGYPVGPYRYLRSFPNGVRNCYRINVTIGTKYLIRASFLYGNYDGLNSPPQFELHLGPNLWGTVSFISSSMTNHSEIIHVPSMNYINICLVKTGNGTPFISAIELRILNNKVYNITESSGSLALLQRFDYGAKYGSNNTTLKYRLNDDVYDRLWSPTAEGPSWTNISASIKLTNDQLDHTDYYNLPATVMSTALQPTNSSASFYFYGWNSNDVNEKYYVYLHFNEVKKLASNETRSFNISFNGNNNWYGPLVPSYQQPNTIFITSALTGKESYQFSLIKTESSTLAPIINAVEFYIVKEFSQLGTQQDDVDAITNIKNAYKLERNWQGDPCAPKQYMWEGLDCSFGDENNNNPPRITSLNLSSSGLTGQIPTYISKLSMLQSLDLSNNSLSGPVPAFLTQLQSLNALNLANNNLSGSVPNGLLERSNAGSLSLSVGQNPYLCASSSPCNQPTENNSNQPTENNSKKKKSSIVIPVVVIIAGILML